MTSARKIKKRAKGRLASLNQSAVVEPTVTSDAPMVADEREPQVKARGQLGKDKNTSDNKKIDHIENMLDDIVAEVKTTAADTVQPVRTALRLSERAMSQDTELLEAVEKLTESMVYRAEEEQKTGIKGWAKGKIDQGKQLFTIPGLARAAGIGQDPSSILGSILGDYEQKQQKKQERIQEKAKYVAEFSELTEAGRGMSKTDALHEGARRFEELQKIDPELKALKEKQSRAKDFGGSLSEADLARQTELDERQKHLTDYSVKAKPQGVSDKLNDALEGFKSGILDELRESTLDEKKAFLSQDPSTIREIFEGAFAELASLSEKQLEELEEISKTLYVSEESVHESGLKQTGLASTLIPTDKQPQEEKGGLLDTVLSGAGSLLSSVGTTIAAGKGALVAGKGILAAKGAGALVAGKGALAAKGAAAGSAIKGAAASTLTAAKGVGGRALGALGRFLPGAAKVAGPAGAVAAAGYGGWQVGGLLNDHVINPAISHITGREGNTLGGAIYDWMNPNSGFTSPTPASTARAQQTQQLARNEQTRLEQERNQNTQRTPATNNISDNRSTTVNNSTVMNVPVRNQEPTLYRRLDRLLVN